MIFLALLFPVFSVSSLVLVIVGFDSFIEYRSPSLDVSSTPLIEPVEPLGERVVIFLVDGARGDRTLEVAKEGVGGFALAYKNGTWFRNARAFAPSISTPSRSAICTGARHEITGVTTNWWYEHSKRHLPISNIFQLAKGRGLKTAAIGDECLDHLFGDLLDNSKYWKDMSDWDTLDVTKGLIEKEGVPVILWVGLNDVDYVGHAAGAASDYYELALRCASIQIKIILDLLEKEGVLDNTLVVMMSDHGMRDERHHGGTEPQALEAFVAMMGPKVKHTVVEDTVYVSQIGSTLSFFLGWELPRPNERLPLYRAFENFENFEGRRSLYGLNYAEERIEQFEALVKAYDKGKDFESDLSVLRSELKVARDLHASGEYKSASPKAEQIGAKVFDLTDQELIPGLQAEARTPRIILLAIAYVVIISLVYLAYRRYRFTLTRESLYTYVIGVLTFQVVFFLLFFASGYRFSMSTIYHDVVRDHLAFVVVGAIACGIATGIFRAKVKARESTLIQISITVLLVAAFNAVILTALGAYFGVLIEFPFSSWTWMMVAFTFLFANTFVGALGWVAAIFSVLIAKHGPRRK